MNPLERLRPVSALSFDCYGTLIDWEAGILEALRPVFEKHGLKFKGEKLLRQYATLEAELESGPFKPYREVLARVARGLGRRLGVELSEEEEGALARSLPAWKAFPDTSAALRRLKKRYKLAVISNVDADLFEGTKPELGVELDWVVTAGEVRAYKPSPENFRFALARIGVPADRLLHAAQSLYHDVAPARALGIGTVWINRRGGRRGTGATPRFSAVPDLEVPDLKTLADLLC